MRGFLSGNPPRGGRSRRRGWSRGRGFTHSRGWGSQLRARFDVFANANDVIPAKSRTCRISEALRLFVKAHPIQAALDLNVKQLDKGVVGGLFVYGQLYPLSFYPNNKGGGSFTWRRCQVKEGLL